MASENTLKRRDLLKGAVAGAGGLAAATLLGPEASADTPARKWDMEADIVCVGYGGAGAVTAITAADLGATVILLEKLPADTPTEIRHTPNTRSSGAHVVATDDAQKASDYLFAASFGKTPREYCDLWAKYTLTNVAFVEKLGGKLAPLSASFRGDFPTLPGWDGVLSRPYVGSGPAFFQMLDENVKKRAAKIRIVFATPGRELLKDASGAVIGVRAEQDGKTVLVKANKAVVLTTGGFEWDEEMKQNFLPGYPAYFYGNMANTGDGIRMAAKAGAALWHFNAKFGRLTVHIPGYPGLKGATPDGFIHINKYGKRFFRERPLPSNSLPLEACVFDNEKAEFPAIPCWSVFDDRALKLGEPATSAAKGLLNGKVQHYYEWSKDYAEEFKNGIIHKADTLEELARLIAADPENGGRIKPDVLRATVERYNAFCTVKQDGDFARQPATLIPILKAPYYAMKLYPGGAMTTGGPKKNLKAQVVDPFEKPIPHLYCAGEMGSSNGELYPIPGVNIGELLIFGRVAAENAVLESPIKS